MAQPARSKETQTALSRVLIIDDEEGIRESLRLLLDEDFQISVAASGEEGLEAAQVERPDAVLLDVVMPGIDGLETLERLHAAYPEVPVIMVTATKTVKTAVEAIKLADIKTCSDVQTLLLMLKTCFDIKQCYDIKEI